MIARRVPQRGGVFGLIAGGHLIGASADSQQAFSAAIAPSSVSHVPINERPAR